jgi:hypothetical protein
MGHVEAEQRRLQSQVERMRSEIENDGESIVGCEELEVLCADMVVESSQWHVIAGIAISERWSFTFFPNGDVRFAKL